MAFDKCWGTIWVCLCCMLIHANGECGDDCHDTEPWGLLKDGERVTMGLLAEEHNENCTEEDRQEGCYCERRDFDKSSCEGCGTALAGERYAFALWSD